MYNYQSRPPFPPTVQKPSLPELTALQGRTQRINIAKEISIQWEMVGTTLLDDKSGTIIPAIAEQYGNNAERINMKILRRWLQGKGISDRTWQGLLGVLRVHCVALAESVEEVLTEKEAILILDPRANSWANSTTHHHHPVPRGTTSSP